ncbi:MAG: hypothetical protein EU532_13815 [Promethearchaeota archaeon]|nr:MAG: hypothetical protein EU532_13815 [Candidatus Lokiarchaeota archaeon]
MSTQKKLQFKDFISESLLRDLILFSFLFMLVIAQNWEDIFLLLFPLITFIFALFFKIIDTVRQKSEIENTYIIYNPLGSEKIASHRLHFSACSQLILLFWFGAESLYHPQLIDDYHIYFISIFIFFYTFGFFSVFIDLWKYSKMEIIAKRLENKDSNKNNYDLDNVISFLKVKSFKIISIINLLVFIILNILNILFAFLITRNLMPGFKYNLPGTGFENSEPVNLSFLIYFIIFLPPSISIGFLFINYRDITNFNREKLNKIISSLPKDTQNKIIDNLVLLNENFKNKLRLE